jgi:hypothetical protein
MNYNKNVNFKTSSFEIDVFVFRLLESEHIELQTQRKRNNLASV